jgi:signal transduction histidine kinase
MKVKTHLVLLVVVVLTPVIVFSALVLNMLVSRERAAAVRSMHELARAAVLAMDIQMTRAQAGAQALAASPNLAHEDFAALYREARAAVGKGPLYVALLDVHGRQMFNTVQPYGVPLPPPSAAIAGNVREVLAGGQPHVSNLILGTTTGQFLVSVEMPVTTDSGNRYVLGVWMFARDLSRLLPADGVPGGWLISVLDRHGVTLARNQRPEQFVGSAPTPGLKKILMGPEKSEFRAVNRAGQDMYGVNDRSSLSGWTVSVGVPVADYERAAVQARTLTIFGFAFAIACAVGGALFLIRRLVQGTQRIALAADMLGEGRAPPPARLEIADFQDVHMRLSHVAERLAAAEAERRAHLEFAQQARVQAEAENRAKDEFLAMLGHELRNPLAPISVAAHMLGMPDLEPERVRTASAVICRQVQHINRLLEDLLDVSRVTRGIADLKRQPVELHDVIHAAVEQVRSMAEGRGQAIDCAMPDAPLVVQGDSARLVQIVSNLLNNASKYSHEGGPIALRVRQRDGWVEIDVADQGIGIAAEFMPRIFDLFSQGSRGIDRRQGGLGIGLALVRSLVRLHGGDITCHSAGPEQGSTFTVRLPLMA